MPGKNIEIRIQIPNVDFHVRERFAPHRRGLLLRAYALMQRSP